MKITALVSLLFLFVFALSSCGGSGTILADKGTFKAVGYPFENPQSQADGKMVAISPNAFIVVSHFELDDSVRFVAYASDSMDVLWRSAAPMHKDEEVDYNALYIESGNLVVFTNRKSKDTVYYCARMVDIKSGKAGDSKVLIKATPDEYGCGYLEPHFGNRTGIRQQHIFVQFDPEKTHNLFNPAFSPDSSKLLLFAIGKDALKTEHTSSVNADVLILDRNLTVLKRATSTFLLPADSGYARGFGIDNSGNVYLSIFHEGGDLITVKQFAILGDGHLSVLRNEHPQNLNDKVDQDDIGIALSRSGKVYVASLLKPKEGWFPNRTSANFILSVSRYDFGTGTITNGATRIDDDTAKKLFNETMFYSPQIEKTIVDENLGRVVVLLQQTGAKGGANWMFGMREPIPNYEDFLGNILISAHSLEGTHLWFDGIRDFEWNPVKARYFRHGYTSWITGDTLSIFHRDGFYLCDEFDLRTGARLTPDIPASSDDPGGLRLLDFHDVDHYPWDGCRLSDTTEVFLSGMPIQNRPMSIVKVMMPR